MPNIQELQEAVFIAVEEVNDLLPAEKRLRKSPDTVLTGDDNVLDSLGLVNFLVAVEKAVGDKFGVAISLINEDSMSRTESPFSTIGSLTEYAYDLISKDPHGSN